MNLVYEIIKRNKIIIGVKYQLKETFRNDTQCLPLENRCSGSSFL